MDPGTCQVSSLSPRRALINMLNFFDITFKACKGIERTYNTYRPPPSTFTIPLFTLIYITLLPDPSNSLITAFKGM
jgi:hypothetical protein